MRESKEKTRPIFTIEQVGDDKVCLRANVKSDGDKNAIREGLYHAMEENDEMADIVTSALLEFIVDNFSSADDIKDLFDEVKEAGVRWYNDKHSEKKSVDLSKMFKGGGMPS